MSDEIHTITEESFEKEVSKGTTLVDFYADWCGPCRMMTPVLEQLAKEMKGKAKVAKLDVDRAQKIASSFRVTSIPTVILFHDGQEVGRLVGLKDGKTLKDFILSAAHK